MQVYSVQLIAKQALAPVRGTRMVFYRLLATFKQNNLIMNMKKIKILSDSDWAYHDITNIKCPICGKKSEGTMEDVKQFLLYIGFDDAHLPLLFNDNDKSNYAIPELMQSYADHKLESMVSLSDVIDRLISSLGECVKGNDYIINADDDGTYWIEHMHVGSGEPLKQWIGDNVI